MSKINKILQIRDVIESNYLYCINNGLYSEAYNEFIAYNTVNEIIEAIKN